MNTITSFFYFMFQSLNFFCNKFFISANMNLYVAELSEIMLALRRDEEQIQLLIDQLSTSFKAFFGDRIWIRSYHFFPYVCRFFYYFSTNFLSMDFINLQKLVNFSENFF